MTVLPCNELHVQKQLIVDTCNLGGPVYMIISVRRQWYLSHNAWSSCTVDAAATLDGKENISIEAIFAFAGKQE